ncbi:chemotaxis protein CheA [Cellulomonas sp. APG4]|uniref:chemotaxis protein CheA n=1 Tax=Cellulomonas sp. APG4 TaxID=1538656 RepID=UPI00137B27DD|nr:chemotaxis protein CheA [Cellulomonas sp. APG4]NCT92665.1 chemotaxis protein CheA [Cellulomonas sp. APG4]
MEELDEIVHEFLVESHENLDQLDSDLVALESAPGSRELLSSIFRTIHTIKGTSGFLAFHSLERVTHVGENLLVELRDGRREMDQRTTDALLRMVDTVRALLTTIEANGTEGDVDVAPVVAEVEAVMADETPEEAPVPEPTRRVIGRRPAAAEPEGEAPSSADADVAEGAPAPVAEDVPPTRKIVARKPAAKKPAAKKATAKSASAGRSASADAVEAGTVAALTSESRPERTTAVVDEPAPAPKAAAPAASAPTPTAPSSGTPSSGTAVPHQRGSQQAPEAEPGTEGSRSVADASIRVDVDLLDALMRQVGELVLARNAITRLAEGVADDDLSRASQRLSLIASELQEGVMKTRMQPIEHVWSKVPRMVRDLSTSCGKQVRLEMIGGDTELDRSLLEAVKDPLTHLIRNAVDHGVEKPEERTAAGKPTQGRLLLRAFHAGGQVVVEVVDDGKGIDPERVAATAVARGLRTVEQTEAMAPGELLQLLFLPGFSTATTVTNVSGRGVGMDVVRTRIEAIGGTVDVESTVGQGTTWRLRIPLTLAIMPALTVECDTELYAIPQVNLLELVALENPGAIERVGSAAVYRLRGELLPLVDLREVFGAASRGADERTVIAVLQSDTQRFGLVLDRVLNTEEIVVKPLAARLKSIGLYAGATLLGDGRVSLILDVQAIARRAMAGELGEGAATREGEHTQVRDLDQVLVAEIGGERRVAIPLSAVTRLEKLPAHVVEHVGGREVVQYRGAITPVVRLAHLLGSSGMLDQPEELSVVVYTHGSRSVAIVVDRIVDIVEDDRGEHSDVDDHGLMGSTVLQGKVTELLDVRQAVTAVDPLFFERELDPFTSDDELTSSAGSTAPLGALAGV